MRYNLESTLPINAFSPRGGRSPFNHSMTLEGGGGGGGILGGVTKAIGSVVGGIEKGVKAVVQPVYNATLKQIPGVDNALVNLDKSVGKAIPGGWGTVGAVASSFIPGGALMGLSQTQLATGLGALSGSGVMNKGNNFNLQGAILGGAMAYGASTLSQGLQNPTATDKIVSSELISPPSGSALSGTGSAGADVGVNIPTNGPGASMNVVGSGAGTGVGMNPTSSPIGIGGFSQPAPSILENATNAITNLPSNIADKATSAFNTLTNPETYSNIGTKLADTTSGTLDNMGKAVSNAGSIIGGSASLPANVNLTNTALPMLIGGTGLAALEEQKKYLEQQASSGAISNAEYNASKAKIDGEIAAARSTVASNPLQTNSDISNVSAGPSLYARNDSSNTLYDKNPSGGTQLLYAMGGSVNPPDDQTGMPTQTPMGNFEQGGLMSMIGRTAPQQMFAAGGIARFLSGGGDGMSDSIPANINGSQEARLADGEFVIPADVVSHLGNGSSKAGAKQLYSMMDKVRQARTGTKKQGKQINPRKYLAA